MDVTFPEYQESREFAPETPETAPSEDAAND